MSEVTFSDSPAVVREAQSGSDRLLVCTECGREAKRLIRKELCGACYERARRNLPPRWKPLDPDIAELLLPVPGTSKTFARRVFHYLDASGDCWEWTGGQDGRGYGVIGRGGAGGGLIRAHSAVWQLLVGAIPDGMVFDHLCRNRSCANPDHGEIVPPGENTKRGYGASSGLGDREVCGFGHPLDGMRRSRGRKVRYCKTCARERVRAKYVPKSRPAAA